MQIQKTLLKIILCVAVPFLTMGQEVNYLSVEEFLKIVAKYHPIANQAGLLVDGAKNKVSIAKSAYDPKISADYQEKKYEGTSYYSILQSEIKIPAWYGVEFKTGYELSNGKNLNPEEKTPVNGLYYTGIQMNLLSQLTLDKRMAALKKSKLLVNASEQERKSALNDLIFEAIQAYISWYAAHNSMLFQKNAVEISKTRLDGIRKMALIGELATIDTVDATNQYIQRVSEYIEAQTKFQVSTAELSNYLWYNNGSAYSIDTSVKPIEINWENKIPIQAEDSSKNWLEKHPDIIQYNIKNQTLDIEKRLGRQDLLPKLTASYAYLSSNTQLSYSLENNYKLGLKLGIPLTQAESRANLKMIKLKVLETNYALNWKRKQLETKYNQAFQEYTNQRNQRGLVTNMVENSKRLVDAEERKLRIGESNLFTVNARENKWVETNLKNIESESKLLKSYYKIRWIKNELL